MRPALHVRKWRTDWNWDFVPWAARYWQCRTDSDEELDSVAWAQSNGWDLFHQENGSLSLSVCVEKVRAESPAQTSEISPSCRSIPFAANVLLFWSSRGNFSNEGPDDLWRRNCTYRQHLQFGYPSRDRISRAYAWLGQRIHDTHMLSFFFTIRKEIELLKMMSPFSVMVRISQRVTVIIWMYWEYQMSVWESDDAWSVRGRDRWVVKPICTVWAVRCKLNSTTATPPQLILWSIAFWSVTDWSMMKTMDDESEQPWFWAPPSPSASRPLLLGPFWNFGDVRSLDSLPFCYLQTFLLPVSYLISWEPRMRSV